jgi:hypothetical protein
MRRVKRRDRLKPQGWLTVALIVTLAAPGGRAVLVDAVTADGPAAVAKAAVKGGHRPALKPKPRAPVAGVTCKTLPAGIRQQESGGNYSVRGVPVGSHGGARAMGAYQVMPANLPSWSREALGREVSVAQYMRSPSIQDRVALHRLGALCASYGPRGAAAAWFSGRPELANDYKPRGGGAASVGAYVDSAMALARRYG